MKIVTTENYLEYSLEDGVFMIAHSSSDADILCVHYWRVGRVAQSV